MPVYDYKCPDHGVFHELATLARSGDPCGCPKCGKPSPRVIMIPPEVLAMAPNRHKTLARNEKASHQPIISTGDSRAEAAEKQAFFQKKVAAGQRHKGCGCNHEHKHDRSQLKQQVVYLPDGSKVFPSQRPWMISH
ncbi:MAG: zinc ribbon domain-containing protein [Ketobacteraceae bacterium]|nr:zinc ribbon domain-containing protein [Ketobacteraceae bacterium]